MNYQELQEAKQTFRIKTLEKEYKSLYKIRDQFVRKFNRKKIAEMTPDEYVEGKQNRESFCYILEQKLIELGNFEGQYVTKFGFWYSQREGRYKCEDRLGTDCKKVFKDIRCYILDLLEAGETHNLDAIVSNRLNALFKGKILSTYFPDEYLGIFSRDHLDHYLKAFDLDTDDLMKQDAVYKREALLKFKNKDKDMKHWSNDMFTLFLWSHYPKAPGKAEDMGAKPEDEEIDFPTLKKAEFIDLQLATEKDKAAVPCAAKGKASPDYEKEARKYKKLGDRGEYVVMQAEVSRLMNERGISEAKAKKLVKWVSRESDAYGYDIQSVNDDDSPRYIEVKATRGKAGSMDFYYTENEYETAKEYGKDYYIYVVYEILTANPKIWRIQNPFLTGKGITMKPIKYRVRLSAK